MIKKSILAIVSFLTGVLVAHFVEGFFRKQIQNIFEWSTFNVISLYGGDYYPNLNIYYLITFGITFAIFAISNFKNKSSQIFKNLIISILIFLISFVVLTSIDANVKIIEPSSYENEVVKWRRSSIVYYTPLIVFIFLASIPSLIKLIKKR